MNATATQRGLSVVELMVGLAIGLLVAAAGITALAQHAGSTRKLLLDARLSHELRTGTELMARHLRRAHHWRGAAEGVWQPGAPPPESNPHRLTIDSPEQLRFSYSSPAGGSPADAPDDAKAGPPGTPLAPVGLNEHFGFRLVEGRVDMQLGEGRWQALTDPRTLRVTALHIEPVVHEESLAYRCARPCEAGSDICPPRLRVHTLSVHMAAHSLADPGLTRQSQHQLRLRNDTLSGSCPS